MDKSANRKINLLMKNKKKSPREGIMKYVVVICFAVVLSVFISFLMISKMQSDKISKERARADKQIVALQSHIKELESALSKANTRITNLKSELAADKSIKDLKSFIRFETGKINGLSGPHLIFEGMNIHIRSGSGATDDGGELSGLGNLIVGYNETTPEIDGKERAGSHNLIIGRGHRFSNFGGLVAGFHNTLTGKEASVVGGRENVAKSDFATVAGGSSNTASGYGACVVGGKYNVANDKFSTISGGYVNTADGELSAVTGGFQNTASGYISSIIGGQLNEANTEYSTVSGDSVNLANTN